MLSNIFFFVNNENDKSIALLIDWMEYYKISLYPGTTKISKIIGVRNICDPLEL